MGGVKRWIFTGVEIVKHVLPRVRASNMNAPHWQSEHFLANGGKSEGSLKLLYSKHENGK